LDVAKMSWQAWGEIGRDYSSLSLSRSAIVKKAASKIQDASVSVDT